MGMFDTVLVTCPKCGSREHFQTKSGKCVLGVWSLRKAPADAENDVMADINRHSPHDCQKCGTYMYVGKNRSVVNLTAILLDRIASEGGITLERACEDLPEFMEYDHGPTDTRVKEALAAHVLSGRILEPRPEFYAPIEQRHVHHVNDE